MRSGRVKPVKRNTPNTVGSPSELYTPVIPKRKPQEKVKTVQRKPKRFGKGRKISEQQMMW